MTLDDDDPLWAQRSGGIGRSGAEWGDGDSAIAEAFYAEFARQDEVRARSADGPAGETLTSDWIATRLSQQLGDGSARQGGNPYRAT